MSDTNKTKFFYKEVVLDDRIELDYLDTELVKIDLTTIDVFTVTAPYEYRPDLISKKVFGDYHYGWLIGIHNGFLDPVMAITIGKSIDIPDIDEYFQFFSENTYSRPRNRKL